MKTKKQYINLLRILAAICITNSHFANIWPVSAIASGGMLGDVLFFAISGYCLFHSEFRFADFGRWYAKRIKRIYITVILIALLNCFVNGFPATAAEWIAVFIYPTQCVRGKVILQPHGKEFFTWYSKHLFTLHGKHFFT